ncbi:MAG: NAD(P)-dependent oxidoreductase, partial [Alphaproteobacteria bacterium]|nr:NAD(P)-dependent oxidoreductase [Alphaproteobacteria bacterium]
MRHVIFGGDGFVGRHLAPKLVADGEEVVVVDIVKSDLAHYRNVRFVTCDVTAPASVSCVGLQADDMVYNLSAKMLSPIQVRAKRHDFFFPVNFHGTENIIRAMDKAGASKLVHYTTDMIYGHTVVLPMTEEHPVSPLGEYGLSKLKTEELAAEWRKRGMS